MTLLGHLNMDPDYYIIWFDYSDNIFWMIFHKY